MYIYRAIIGPLSARMVRINLNTIFCTHAEHSPTNAVYVKCYISQKGERSEFKPFIHTCH